jgi:hypothetical protein
MDKRDVDWLGGRLGRVHRLLRAYYQALEDRALPGKLLVLLRKLFTAP